MKVVPETRLSLGTHKTKRPVRILYKVRDFLSVDVSKEGKFTKKKVDLVLRLGRWFFPDSYKYQFVPL